ncbi:MAG: hypothetical protein IKB02_05775 [Clostridia bacterium]|nr:hypothetical protein [Clostridia bacterium]
MEKEQIIKALEWCSELRLCVDCPMRTEGYFSHSGNACRKSLMENALALIKQQDEQIFQLENRLKECENGYAGTLHLESCKLHDAEEKVKELTEENERLKSEVSVKKKLLDKCVDLEDRVRADTVREMQERFKELMGNEYTSCGFCNAEGYWSVNTVRNNIDRIADEILNENTEE